uniref:Protein cereblon n=1 Tax=Strigamia maritima TaxID=126957 RepID=T1JIH3_STRMM
MAEDLLLPLLGYRDGNSKEEDDARIQQATSVHSDISYDQSLPAQHTYLGTDLDELSGRTVLEDDVILNLPLLSLPGVVLIPGQTLPLHLFQPPTVAMVKNIIDHDRTFGMVNSRYLGPNYMPSLAPIGTTAEIRSYKEEIEERSGLCTIRVKAEGRQRFQIIDTRRQSDGILLGQVKILSDIVLRDALEGARSQSMLRFLKHPPREKSVSLDHDGHEFVLKNKLSKAKYDRLRPAHFTWWPPWVYKQYDQEILMSRIKQELIGWNNALKLDSMPRLASEFSFWVAANLPLDDTLRLNILAIDSPIQRLRCELSILEKCTALCCRDCDVEITDKTDVFSMSIEGPQSIYVNPGGYVHETLTVHKVRSVRVQGESSTEYSWFPGFAWSIVHCRSCGNHLGWKFTATDKNLKPDKFWGLCRSSLHPGIKNDNTGGDDWAPCI